MAAEELVLEARCEAVGGQVADHEGETIGAAVAASCGCKGPAACQEQAAASCHCHRSCPLVACMTSA